MQVSFPVLAVYNYTNTLFFCSLKLQQLRHANLVNLIEVFRRKKRLYLVFGFVDHTALDDRERYPTGADEGYVKKVMWQVLKGVEFCHSHNVRTISVCLFNVHVLWLHENQKPNHTAWNSY